MAVKYCRWLPKFWSNISTAFPNLPYSSLNITKEIPLNRTWSSVASVSGTHSDTMCSWTEVHPTRYRAILSPSDTVTPSVREYRQQMSASVGYVSAISWNITWNQQNHEKTKVINRNCLLLPTNCHYHKPVSKLVGAALTNTVLKPFLSPIWRTQSM